MEEFEDSQLRDLQEVDGIVLRDVHGERVAIGKGFPYENIFSFMVHYFNFYTADDFAIKMAMRCLNIGFPKKQNLLSSI